MTEQQARVGTQPSDPRRPTEKPPTYLVFELGDFFKKDTKKAAGINHPFVTFGI